MAHLSFSPRIAFIDLTFNWPPTGGCWIDAFNIIHGLQQRGASVCLFYPQFQEFFPRGEVKEELPFPSKSIPFNRYTFNGPIAGRRFREAVEAFQPDRIFLLDGYYMKNHLISALGPERCMLRFYAYEILCINLHYYRYHENRICGLGFFEDPANCERCWFRRMPMWGRAIQVFGGRANRQPALHFSHEYITSLAFTSKYRRKLKENFSRLSGVIVSNEFMKSKLSHHCPHIHVFPHGVDTNLFRPSGSPCADRPARIFFPGRADDSLKGLQTLVLAGDLLERQGLEFEMVYTSPKECPSSRPWLHNHGWLNQEDLAKLYHEVDIVVAPSLWVEPFGITVLEGMASSLPVVASNHGGLAETVVDGVTGYHVPPGDHEALAMRLKELICSPLLRRELGEKGRERVVRNYTWDHILDSKYVPLMEQR